MANKMRRSFSGMVIGHNLVNVTEKTGPVAVTILMPFHFDGRIYRKKATLVVHQDELGQYPIGMGLEIRPDPTQTEINFGALGDQEEGEDENDEHGNDADGAHGERVSRRRRGSGAPASTH